MSREAFHIISGAIAFQNPAAVFARRHNLANSISGAKKKKASFGHRALFCPKYLKSNVQTVKLPINMRWKPIKTTKFKKTDDASQPLDAAH